MPKDRSDLAGLVTSVFLVTLIAIIDLATLYHQSSDTATSTTLVKLSIGVFILVNLMVNQLKAILTDTSIHAIDLPNVLMSEWRYCAICELNAPPRSHHCFSCKKCILKRNNHCLFLGKCVGHRNHRYYLLFVVYVWLGTVYSLWLNQNYFIDMASDFTFKKFFTAFVPLLAVVIRMISVADFFYIFGNSVCLLLSLMLFFYALINFNMAVKGQTWHESSQGITKYRLSWSRNLVEIFGLNWRWAVVNPFARLNLPGDGSKFRTNMKDVFNSAKTSSYFASSHESSVSKRNAYSDIKEI